MSESNFIMFKKPRYCPNASSLGYSRPYVSVGDFISYRHDYEGAPTEFGRVLCEVRRDGMGETYMSGDRRKIEPRLLVLTAGHMFSHGYERHVARWEVTEVLAPGDFTRWFFFGTVPPPELALAFIKHGSMGNSYIGQYLTSPEGEIVPHWREIFAKRAPSPRDTPPPGPEPGELIAKVGCPCCGADLTVEHGDEPGEVACIGSGGNIPD